MMNSIVDYEPIAPTYNQRYAANDLQAVEAALRQLAVQSQAGRILEVGCGTGHWLPVLQSGASQVCGLDLSPGMLQQARRADAALQLVCGQATQLPFRAQSFDLVLCVNAIHHFARPRRFLAEAKRLLRPGGALAIIGANPHPPHDRWYLYQYFAGVLETDQQRFASWGTLSDWLIAEGFDRLKWQMVQRLVNSKVGRAVLDDPYLQKANSSQLALLSDEAYAAGVRKIEAALVKTETQGKALVFPMDLHYAMLVGMTEDD